MARTHKQIREYIKAQRTKVYEKYSGAAYEDSDWWHQQGSIYGYEEALDDLELFLDGK
jgi:hypothetical protein